MTTLERFIAALRVQPSTATHASQESTLCDTPLAASPCTTASDKHGHTTAATTTGRRVSTLLASVLLIALACLFLGGCEAEEPISYVGSDGRVYFEGLEASDDYQHISGEEAAQLIEWGDCTVVDVRGPIAYEIGHIPGAIDFLYDDKFVSNAQQALPNQHDTIVVYCDYGGISKLAAQDLADAGYTNIVEFNGLEVWEGELETGPYEGPSTQGDDSIPWDKWASGLLLGMLFGYIAKRSRFCLTGLVRDVYLERRGYNIALILAIISIQGLLYFAMGQAGIIRLPLYLPPFSLFSIAAGGLLFGFGAVLMNGCLISTLVKCGDGRIIGLLSLAIFIVVGYFFSAGPGNELTSMARSVAIIDDRFIGRLGFVPIIGFMAIAVICIIAMMVHTLRKKPPIKLPAQYTGLRHWLFEATWSREFMVVAIALVLAMAFPISEAIGRHYGFAVATPVLSWAYTLLDPPVVVGGCNPFDLRIGWASFLVLGIVVGSFISTIAAGEFALVLPNKKVLGKSIAGSILMGIGAVLGQGCLLSNGLVGTAQFSAKSWYALVFLVIGILLATRIFLKTKKSK